MKLSDVSNRLQAPFPEHLVGWKPAALSKDRTRALLLAHIDARAIQDRLDAICPNDWAFEIDVVQGARLPTVKGRLTVLGVAREDIGEAPEGDLGTLKAASSDALKRCAVHFGIGRYLYDLPKQWVEWDDAARKPVQKPALPEWARPDYERTPGGAHLVQAMAQLKYELPEDLDLQREVYKHLKAALGSLHAGPDGQLTYAQPGGITPGTKRQIAAYLKGPRWGFVNDDRRRAFTAWLAGLESISSSGELTEEQGQTVLGIIKGCTDPEAKIAEWQTATGSAVA